MNILIADTAPLIFLAKLTLLDVLCDHLSVIIPPEVALEATRRQDLPDATYIRSLIEDKKILVDHASSKNVATFRKHWGLGAGESSALLMAQIRNIPILTDDYPAMRVAKALRVSFVTTPLIIVELNKQGLISVEVAKAKLDRLQDYAWLNTDILEAAQNLLKGGER